MLGIQVREQRFSLYHLEEGEIYIKDFIGEVQCVNPITEQIDKSPGIIHIGSRSIIFEPDDSQKSILKFHFRNFIDKPKILFIDKKEIIKIMVSKIIEVPYGKTPKSFQTYDITSDCFLEFIYTKVDVTFEIIFELLEKFNNKQTIFEFDSIEYIGNIYNFKFDYTRIKSINEKFYLKQEIFVKKIVPLIEVPGLLMLTETRLYYQPLFTLNNKRSYSLKYANIEKLYKRRVKLREVITL
jgi:factor associated with neutral sphingomyelinase activation